MQDRDIWLWVAIASICIMLLGNRKVRIWRILKEQVLICRNADKNRFSPWDFICFFILPVAVSFIMVYKLGIMVDADLAELLTTVFSIVFTVLFGFAAVLVGKLDSTYTTERRVTAETFVSIVFSTLVALIAAILSIILTQVIEIFITQIISALVLSASLIIAMSILMVTKRIFFIYIDTDSTE